MAFHVQGIAKKGATTFKFDERGSELLNEEEKQERTAEDAVVAKVAKVVPALAAIVGGDVHVVAVQSGNTLNVAFAKLPEE